MEFIHPPTTGELLALYAAPRRRWVRVNFVTTLDGHATGADGLSGSINSPGDKEVFDTLRALSDVVVVGAGTVRAEGYRRLRSSGARRAHRRESGLPAHPTLAVVTASGDLPEALLERRPETGELVVLCTDRTPPAARSNLVDHLGRDAVVPCGTDTVQPHEALEALRARALEQVLCEGGPHLFGDWLSAGVVDELCLTVRPLLLGGDGPRIVQAARTDSTALAVGNPRLVLQIGQDLMLRYQLDHDTD